MTLVADDAAARSALDGLSGEIHATQRTAMVRAAAAGQDAVRSRLFDPVAGSGIWGQAIGQGGDDQGDAGTAAARRHSWERSVASTWRCRGTRGSGSPGATPAPT